jgi:hypothetical protein
VPRTWISQILALISCVFLTIAAAQAEESADAEANDMIELFVGITHDDGENNPSLGLTYEHQFGRFGTGFIAEFTDSDSRDAVLAIPFFWHPAEPWRTVLAVGTEIDGGDNSFLTRVGASYEIGFNGWSLSPEINLDFVDSSTVLVFGASFVWKF